MTTAMRAGPPVRKTRRATGAPTLSDDEALRTRSVDPGIVRSRWDIIKRVQLRERREFWINQAFFLDEQWIRFDKNTLQVQRVEFADATRLRLTINRIRPNLTALLSKLTQRELTFQVMPSAPDDALALAARTAEQVLTAAHASQRWEDLRNHELMAAYLGGTSAVSVEWDATKGTDLGTQTEEGRRVGTGDVVLTALNITEFGLQPGIRSADEGDWWVRAVALPPSQARERYNLDWTPEPDASAEQTLVLLYDSSWRPVADRCLVLTYFGRPTPANPKGCVGTVIAGEWVDGPHDWPFPFIDRLNLAVFRQSRVIGRWSGDTIVATARPVQVAYNHARSNIAEHLKLAGNARLGVPDVAGGVFDQLTDTPGEIFPFPSTLPESARPFYLAPPNLPPWMGEHANDLRNEIDNIMGISNPTPSNDTQMGMSGYAIAQLAEKDNTPLGLVAHDQAEGWSWVGTMVLQTLAANASETRRSTVAGPQGLSGQVHWSGKALMGQTTAKVPLEAVLPRSRTAQQAYAKELLDHNPPLITSLAQYAQIADLPDAEQMIEATDPDVAKAQRENHQMSQGMVLVPADFDDDAKHIAEHDRFCKSSTYEQLVAQTRQDVRMHRQAHEVNMARKAGEAVLKNQIHAGIPTPDAPGGQPPPAGPGNSPPGPPPGPPAPPDGPEAMPGAPGAPAGPGGPVPPAGGLPPGPMPAIGA